MDVYAMHLWDINSICKWTKQKQITRSIQLLM